MGSTCVGRGNKKENFLWFSIFHVIQQKEQKIVERETFFTNHSATPDTYQFVEAQNKYISNRGSEREIENILTYFQMKYNIFPHKLFGGEGVEFDMF